MARTWGSHSAHLGGHPTAVKAPLPLTGGRSHFTIVIGWPWAPASPPPKRGVSEETSQEPSGNVRGAGGRAGRKRTVPRTQLSSL